jgi:hypothetical protein
MLALYHFAAGIEKEEGASTERALGFTSSKTFVTDQGSLLIADESTDRHTPQRACINLTINFRGGHESGQY